MLRSPAIENEDNPATAGGFGETGITDDLIAGIAGRRAAHFTVFSIYRHAGVDRK